MKEKYITRSFYKVLSPFIKAESGMSFQTGDILLFDPSTHSRVVKLASPKSKTVYCNFFSAWDYDSKKALVELGFIEPIYRWELKKIYHHLTERIKYLAANHELLKPLPKLICYDCGRKGNPLFDKNAKPKIICTDICAVCGEEKPLTHTSLFGTVRIEGFKP